MVKFSTVFTWSC